MWHINYVGLEMPCGSCNISTNLSFGIEKHAANMLAHLRAMAAVSKKPHAIEVAHLSQGLEQHASECAATLSYKHKHNIHLCTIRLLLSCGQKCRL